MYHALVSGFLYLRREEFDLKWRQKSTSNFYRVHINKQWAESGCIHYAEVKYDTDMSGRSLLKFQCPGIG